MLTSFEDSGILCLVFMAFKIHCHARFGLVYEVDLYL